MRMALFTSESVTEGHPDKLCDRISDSILDLLLSHDPYSRVAVETLAAKDVVHIAGEVTTAAPLDVAVEAERVARRVMRDTGYTSPETGIGADSAKILISLSRQSPDIAQGVNERDGEHGAGDQGLMFGYACDETPELMPLPITLAHRLVEKLTDARKSGALPFLRPDGKSQVTVEYAGGKPVRLDAVVLSAQHSPDVAAGELQASLLEHVVKPVCGGLIDGKTKIYINPTGRFVIGGPLGDTGLTGRKIIVDTYGGMGRHGGGAFSGKDPTKVDRSAAYMARYVAKNIVAAGLARRCEVQLSYAIGVAQPVSILVDTFGTAAIPEERIAALIRTHFPLSPSGIIRHFGLRQALYAKTAAYGHFGRDCFPWERTDKAIALRDDPSAR